MKKVTEKRKSGYQSIQELANQKKISVAECKFALGKYTSDTTWEDFELDLVWFGASLGVSPKSSRVLLKNIPQKVSPTTLEKFVEKLKVYLALLEQPDRPPHHEILRAIIDEEERHEEVTEL
jgi:hypothetical protein